MLAAALLMVVVAAPGAAIAQARPAHESREHAFIEALRREDPATADRYVALREARVQAIADLRRVEAQINAAGPELRSAFIQPLVQARKKYAEASLALLDFYEERDLVTIRRYQEEIDKINAMAEERRRNRAELEKLRTP